MADTAIDISKNPMAAAAAEAKQRQQTEKAAETALTENRAAATKIEDSSWDKYQQTSDDLDRRFSQIQKDEETATQDFKPPPPQDPLKGYGATLAGLMGIASLFTRSSMVPALNAGAAAINAQRAANTEEYDRNFDEWKVHHDNLQKKVSWETDAWKQVFDKAKTDISTASGMASAIIARTNDVGQKLLWEQGDIDTALKLQDTRTNMAYEADNHAKIIQEKADKANKVTAAIQKAKDAASSYKQTMQQGQQLLSELDDVKRTGTQVTGIGGAINRAYEGMRGQVADLAGRKPTTQLARDFSNDLENFRNQTRLTVANSKYMSKSAHDYLDELVKGDNYWDTPEDARRTIQNVNNILAADTKELPKSVFQDEGLGDVLANEPVSGSRIKYNKGQIIKGGDGKSYRVLGGDPYDPDVEPVSGK